MLSPRFTNLIQDSLKPKLASKCNCQIWGSLPQAFPHCVLNQNKPNAFYSSCRMSQLMISDSYDELMVDPSLLQSFFGGQMDVHPWATLFVHCSFSCGVREAFLPTNLLGTVGKGWGWLPHQSGQKGYECWNCSLSNFSNRQGGWGKAGKITAFCRTDQAKVEPLDALSTLVQQDSPKPGVVVVKGFTNLLHLLWDSWIPYPDVTTLLAGAFTA